MSSLIRKNHNSGQSGSALLTAMIFSLVVAMLSGSYLYLASSEYRVASRAYLLGASFNLAEGGIDQALHTLRENDKSGWRSGTSSGGDPYWAKTFGSYDLGGNIDGYVNVVILNPSSMAPEIYSEGEVLGHPIGALKKQVYAELSSGFYPFMNGFNSERGLVLKGNNVIFDSYDSRNGPYGFSNIGSEITVSTISVDVDAIDIGNADVYGYVATGGSAPDVGPHGSITDYANPGVTDASRITTDYYAEFPSVSEPNDLTSVSNSIPNSGSISGGDYRLSSWSMAGNDVLNINGDTRIVVEGDISLGGNAAIVVASGATLEIFVKGDASIGGNGIFNSSQQPSQLLVFGTNTTKGGQSLTISGNGFLAASVYAPNAEVALNGGGATGRVYGAIAAYEGRLVGNSHFSYDEALEDFNLGGSGYAVEKWVELSGQGLSARRLEMADYGF